MKRVGRVEIPQEAFLAVLEDRNRSEAIRWRARAELIGRTRARSDRAADWSTRPAAAIASPLSREYFESICVAVILALFVRTFVVQAFKIPTGSMENNLLIGDHLLVNKFVFAPTLTGARAGAAADRPDPARRHHRLQVSRGSRARFHQARHRPARRNDRAAGTRRSTSTARALDEPYVHFLFPPDERGPEDVDFDVRRAATAP